MRSNTNQNLGPSLVHEDAVTKPHHASEHGAADRRANAHVHRHNHAVQFYDSESFLSSVVAEFLADGIGRGEPCVVIATPNHRAAFVSALRAAGVKVGPARRDGLLLLLDARSCLDRFMRGAVPDRERFQRTMSRVFTRTSRTNRGALVRAYGEMVDLLWKDGNTEGAIQLEELWNELSSRYQFSLLCAYAMGNFYRASDADLFRRICGQHSHVAPAESYVNDGDESRLVEISLLQQRSRALESEIVQRELLEQRLRETLIAVQEREEDLRDVLENAAEGIHLVAPDGTIQWANAAELNMLGYTAEEYIGRNIADIHADQPVINDMLARLSRGETLRSYEARLRCKDGSIRHVIVSSNVRWRDGNFQHTRCFSRDVTEQRQAALERELALERERAARADAERARIEADRARLLAEQANRAKSDFLAVMSHELRTPLNAIGGYAELMELGIHGTVSPEQREALERIQRSQQVLLGLINQVLNYARIESGNVRYDVTNVALDEVIRSSEALLQPQLRAKVLQYQYSGCAPQLTVRADAEKLQQILLNLLTNALKFTERGGAITVDVEGDDPVLVRVRDTGIGIAAGKLQAIFDPFVQINAHYTRTRDGVGLGLAISRDLARGMSGDISVESVEGEGSTFTLRLQRAPVVVDRGETN
jgi:PAS domain S-box-containing protein